VLEEGRLAFFLFFSVFFCRLGINNINKMSTSADHPQDFSHIFVFIISFLNGRLKEKIFCRIRRIFSLGILLLQYCVSLRECVCVWGGGSAAVRKVKKRPSSV
jgi:hypothetical protein